MSLKVANITFDCVDALRQATFWAAVLGLPVKPEPSPHFAALEGGPDGPAWLFAQVPEPKNAKNRMHIDLEAEDRDAEVARLVRLGAVQIADKDEWGIRWTVLQDPEGNEFCVSGPHP